jgi:hypothetical protein
MKIVRHRTNRASGNTLIPAGGARRRAITIPILSGDAQLARHGESALDSRPRLGLGPAEAAAPPRTYKPVGHVVGHLIGEPFPPSRGDRPAGHVVGVRQAPVQRTRRLG